jgi:hypothetical protein
MKERVEKKIALGLIRKSPAVVEEIEKTAEKMARQGWHFLHSETDIDLKTISLFFEREMRD